MASTRFDAAHDLSGSDQRLAMIHVMFETEPALLRLLNRYGADLMSNQQTDLC